MRPDEEPEDRDRDRRERNEHVPEDPLAREAGDDFGNDTHRRQNNDVDGGMRVEPEQVLEQQRVAAQFRIEDTEMQGAFRDNKDKRDRDDRRPKNLDDAG